MQDTGNTHLCLNHVQKQQPWHIIFLLLPITAQFLKGLQLILKSKYMFLILLKRKKIIWGTVYYLSSYLIHTYMLHT